MPRPYLGTQPNILIIRTDDAPLDKYTVEGMPLFMANWYSQFVSMQGMCSLPLCAPSRAAGLTGKTVIRHGVWQNTNAGVMDREDTFLWAAMKAGYYTGAVGKYLNPDNANVSVFPATDTLGCHERYVYDGEPGYLAYKLFEASRPVTASSFTSNGTQSDYVTDRERTRVKEIISRAGVRPFCIYWAPKCPHKDTSTGPIPATRHSGASITLVDSPSFGVDPATVGGPQWLIDSAAGFDAAATRLEHIEAHRTLRSFDEAVDDILTTLQTAGKLSNTIVIITTDNAHAYGELRQTDKGTNHISASQMLLLVRAPNGVGGTRSQIIADYDLGATIAALVGHPLKKTPDGMNFWPVVQNASAPWRDGILLYNPLKNSPRFYGWCTANGPGGNLYSSGSGMPTGDAAGQTWGWSDTHMITNIGPEAGSLAAAQKVIDSMAALSVL